METSTRRWPLLDRLRAHKGGLVRIRSELFWYGGRGGWDGVPGRLCLVLDVATNNDGYGTDALDARTYTAAAFTARVAALLLVDGSPRWVLVNEGSVELLDGDHR